MVHKQQLRRIRRRGVRRRVFHAVVGLASPHPPCEPYQRDLRVDIPYRGMVLYRRFIARCSGPLGLARAETEDAVDERSIKDARNTRGQRRSEARPSEDGSPLDGLSGAPLADRSRCCCRRHDGFRPEGRRSGFVSSLSGLIVVMALLYVGAAALGQRRASWVVLLAGLPVAFFAASTLGINPSMMLLLLAAAIFLVVGAVRGRSGEAGGLALQAAGVLVFGARPAKNDGDQTRWRLNELRSTRGVRGSGVDPIQEGEHPLPHRLRGGMFVLG